MDFRRHIKVVPLRGLQVVPFLNLFFLILVFLVFVTQLTSLTPFGVKLPKAITSDMMNGKEIKIVVTGENIMYVHDKIVTVHELKDFLAAARPSSSAVLIKADRRASIGRVVEIWDMGRSLGFSTINLAADREE